jgi:predicted ArsR family transcriptional regulator
VPANSPSFTSTVSAITDAFGDPTRRGIYLFARDAAGGVTAAQVAARFGVHPNVARHHLDKLAAGGYLEVAVERAEGAGAGRPSKHYRLAADAKVDLTADVPVHSDDLVLSLLGRALALLPHDKAEAMAEEVGQEYGALAQAWPGRPRCRPARCDRPAGGGRRSPPTVRRPRRPAATSCASSTTTAAFGDVAIDHPVICAVDRGMVKGMLTALYGDADVATMQSLPQGDTFCATSV